MDINLSRCEVAQYCEAMNEMKAFGDLIRRARERRGMRADELAPLLGMGGSTLSNIENGHRKSIPEPELVDRLHEALGIPKERMLQTLGYLDPQQPTVDGVTLPAGDPRIEFITLLEGASDAEVEGVLRVLRPVLDMVQRSDIQSPKAATQPRSRSTRDAS